MWTLPEIKACPWLKYPAPLPEGPQQDLGLPWITAFPARVVTAVEIKGEVYIVTRHPRTDEICETYRVLT